MGHIAPEIAKQMVSNGVIKGVEVDSATMIQHCNSCEYAKATRKPIKKFCETPRAAKFGDEISVCRSGLVWFLDCDLPQLQPQPVGTAGSSLINRTEPHATGAIGSVLVHQPVATGLLRDRLRPVATGLTAG